MRHVRILLHTKGLGAGSLFGVGVRCNQCLFRLGFCLQNEFALACLDADDCTKPSPRLGSHPLEIYKHVADLDSPDEYGRVARHVLVLVTPLRPSIFIKLDAADAVLGPQKVAF